MNAETLILGMIAAAFVTFGVTLFGVSIFTNRPER